MSQEPCSRSVLMTCLLLPIRSAAMRRVSSAVRAERPSIFTGTSWPSTSTWGGLPGEKIRSLTFSEARNIAASNAWVGTAPGGWVPSSDTEIGATPVAAMALSSHQQNFAFPQWEHVENRGGALRSVYGQVDVWRRTEGRCPKVTCGGVTCMAG